MVQILRNKNLATRFQILVEIANSGPNIQQRDIAKKLGITPQAVSDYVKHMESDGLLTISEGYSSYKLTNDGVNWIIKMLRELSGYNDFVLNAINDISVCAAVADTDLTAGQRVGLTMKEGVLFASEAGGGATGIVFADARAGHDVGVYGIEGIIDFQVGKIIILRVPGIQKGGSRAVDTELLRVRLKGAKFIGVVGIEAMMSVRKVNESNSIYLYGVKEAVIEAARSGLSPVVVCIEDEIAGLIKRLEDEKIEYELVSLSKPENEKK